VEEPAARYGIIVGASMPGVCVEDKNLTGRSLPDNSIGMGGYNITENILRKLGVYCEFRELCGDRHLPGDIVQSLQGVNHMNLGIVESGLLPVSMERLSSVPLDSFPAIERANFEIAIENVSAGRKKQRVAPYFSPNSFLVIRQT